LTNEQWQALVSAGYARTAQYAGDDSYQGYTYYVRTAKYDREYPLFASDETEEDLTAKGL
jgi:Ser/Thr protein kinase RdoA (MazF antagonist)